MSVSATDGLPSGADAGARRAVPHLPGIHELKTAIAARRGMSEDNLQRYDELMDASDAVVELGRADEIDDGIESYALRS